jgi:hypothetical protein
MTDQDFTAQFLAGELAPEGFDHQAHLRIASLLLAEQPFLEACIAMRDGLRRIADKAGKPDLYHETVTVTFMAIIAERMASFGDKLELLPNRSDLFDREMLGCYYSPERLASSKARRMFVMPDRARCAS